MTTPATEHAEECQGEPELQVDALLSCASLNEEASSVSSGSTDHRDSQPRFVHFHHLQLLSSKTSSLTKNRSEIGRIIHELTTQAPEDIPVVNAIIPVVDNQQYIQLVDCDTSHVVLKFLLSQVLFCAKGSSVQTNRSVLFTTRELGSISPSSSPKLGASDESTLLITADTDNNSDATPGPRFQTHLVKCRTTYEASRLLYFVAELLSRKSGKSTNPLSPDHGIVRLRLIVDIREEEKSGENEWKPVPKEKSEVFKLRAKTRKRLVVGLHQTTGLAQVAIESCLDVSVAYGRFINDSEFTRLGHGEVDLRGEAASTLLAGSSFATYVQWPTDHQDFAMFDQLSGKDECIFFTVCVRLVLSSLDRPFSLYRVCRARIYRSDELFWLMADRKPVIQDFTIHLSEYVDEEQNLFIGRFVEALKIVPSGLTQGPTSVGPSPQSTLAVDLKTGSFDNEDDDENEPLMSGHGYVSQEVTDDQLLKDWGSLIPEWHAKLKENPPPLCPSASNPDKLLLSGTMGPRSEVVGNAFWLRIKRLVNLGVPDALRAEVWPLLASCTSGESDLMSVYRILLTKPCKHDAVIQRDLARTFPAHSFFRQQVGQEYLFQVGRAYALYDEEVGYCQGLSFFAAVLLLHMPVEQAFALMVQVNNHYGVRELFLNDFDGLHMRLYQLEKIVQDQLPDVAKHFSELGLETHMYASQWFLTLFTAKFPLQLVFHIVDLFLAELEFPLLFSTQGMVFILKVAFTLLRLARRDLLGLDFEGVLKYLRVTMPKRFIDVEAGNELLTMALSARVSSSKLCKYGKEWRAMRAAQIESDSPIQALERQVAALRNQVNHLERENEALASGLISSKTSMHRQVDRLEDKAEVLTRELFVSRQDLQDTLEEKHHLESEVTQVKQMLRTTLEQAASERMQQQNLIAAYRAIASDLNRRCNLLQQLHRTQHSDNGDPDSEHIPDSSSDTDSLYMRLLWVLLQQASTCESCGPVLEASVTQWKRDLSPPSDADNVDELLEDFLVNNGVENSTRDELPEVLSESTYQNAQKTLSNYAPFTAKTAALKYLKPKQWLAQTFNTLRAMTSNDGATSGDEPRTKSHSFADPQTHDQSNGC
ncbi:hypothetical protein T265_10936 [Opisthorchis viverrini]|uniref:Rab-GAP TBC domain-containing protein n=1 Tax=Opisthorchis viverrini TaxID=6198 RepID=A0A074Z0P8_OPIVI|nr:hypothetical protein T265_10936 [Opisthorchis viverrini]KER20533.1 hypothetical protein T265_10936 [Opisthorchis viverrini]